MTWRAIQAAFKVEGLDTSAKVVLIALAFHANADRRAWPTLALLAQETGFNAKTVQRAKVRLEEKGCISVIHRPGTVDIVSLTLDFASHDPGHPVPRNRNRTVRTAGSYATTGQSTVKTNGHDLTCRCHGDGLIVTANGVFACNG